MGEQLMTSLLRITAVCFATLLVAPLSPAQTQTQGAAQAPGKRPEEQRPRINFAEYVNDVLRFNLDLAVQRSAIAISQAGVTTASARPDWSVDFGLPSFDISNQGSPTSLSTGLIIPIELGGKRGRRIRSATADVATVNADYEDAVRQFRATAADAFITALGARDILRSKNKSLGEFDRIVTVNEERSHVGDIGEIELVQSRVNRDHFKADVIIAQADVYNADVALAKQLGQPERLSAQLPIPSGTLEIPVRSFDVDQLVADALQHRSDVISKTRALRAVDRRIELARANLVPDISVSGSYSHTGTGTGGFSQPPDNTLGASISLNLPLSRRLHPGELEAARASRTQAELLLRSAQLRVQAEVRDAYSRYQASVQRLRLYQGGMLKDADRVLEARLYAYQRGGATLLEVIDAERTSADVYLAYSQALADHAHALVALELTSGVWDVSF
jgi:cobalt-zinc-cadmium efflux system outer membrane protein